MRRKADINSQYEPVSSFHTRNVYLKKLGNKYFQDIAKWQKLHDNTQSQQNWFYKSHNTDFSKEPLSNNNDKNKVSRDCWRLEQLSLVFVVLIQEASYVDGDTC